MHHWEASDICHKDRFLSKKSENYFTDWEIIKWDSAIPRVLLYAVKRVRYLNLSIDPEDLVSHACEKAISGERKWYPENCKLDKFLMGVVSSEITNYAKKKINNEHIQFEIIEEKYNNIEINDNHENIFYQENLVDRKQQRKILSDFLEDQDVILKKIADLILDFGISHPKELSEELKISIEDAKNAKKRLRRALKKFLSNSPQSNVQGVSSHAG